MENVKRIKNLKKKKKVYAFHHVSNCVSISLFAKYDLKIYINLIVFILMFV